MANQSPAAVPIVQRRAEIVIITGIIGLAVLGAGSQLIDTYVNWLWFSEVGYRSVFSTVLLTRVAQFMVAGLVVGGLLALNLVIAYRCRPLFARMRLPKDPMARCRAAITARLHWVGVGIPALVGLLAGLSARGDWQTVQMFVHGVSFGVSDPQFHKDIGFCAFRLPFYRKLLDWAFVTVVLCFAGAVVTHYVFGGLQLVGRGVHLSDPARFQLALLVGIFMLLKVVAYFLDRYGDFAAEGEALTDLDAATRRFEAAAANSGSTAPTPSSRAG